MVDFKNVTFSYDKKKDVLKNVSFTLNDGECAVLLGPNGIGKTTILKCIIGELKVKEGTITINGTNINKIKYHELADRIAFVPQSINANELTVGETILLGRLPTFKIYPKKEDYEALDKALTEFELEEIRDKKTNEISGGEKQKCAIARAYIQNTSTIIFDEPTSNLDIKAQTAIVSLIDKITKENKKSTLLSVHDINLALALADKLILLKDNAIYKIVTPEEVTNEDLSIVYDTNIKIIEVEGRRLIINENNN